MTVTALIIIIDGGNNSIQIVIRFQSAWTLYILLGGMDKAKKEFSLYPEGDPIENYIQRVNWLSSNGKNFHGVP